MVERLERAAKRLGHFPWLGRKGRVEGTSALVVHANYILVYRVTDTAVEVLNVVHAREQYPGIVPPGQTRRA